MLTVADRIELARLREMATRLEPKFTTPEEAHDFMLNEVFRPCLQQLKTDGCFPSERQFLEQSLALWREVYSHAVA